MKNKYISWRRVSTFRQSKSGLGLEAQSVIIRYFVEREGGKIIADYTECYTGKELSGCVELHKAIEHAKREGAILVIAKTDRFRNTIEALQIYEEMGDGNIMFCDLPHTDKFTLTLFFALAEREALIVSIRTKQALAAKKKQGGKLGAKNEKWVRSWQDKTKEEKHAIGKARGATKNQRYLAQEDVVVFLEVVKKVFPDACMDEDKSKWDWKKINSKADNRDKMVQYMRDYQKLFGRFKKWDFNASDKEIRQKMANQILCVRRAVMFNSEN